MNKYDKEYESFQIFEQIQEEEASHSPLAGGQKEVFSFEEAPYYEIEYDAGPVQDEEIMPVPGAVSISGGAISAEGAVLDSGAVSLNENQRSSGEADEDEMFLSSGQEFRLDKIQSDVIQPDRILPPEKDEIRELFNRMRDIAREDRYLNFRSSKFYDQRMQRENSKTFYKQGMFMKDFEDDYVKAVPYSAYFPNYQMMGYDQLRTFFTWRTQVRQGRVEHISLSYAFLYIYELLNNICVDSPEEGLEQLLFFWDAFRVYDESIDKYVQRWLKDYYIYYELPGSFMDFVEENGLEAYYTGLKDEEDSFDSYCTISKYDIRKSTFYGEGREDMVQRCFSFTLERLREALAKNGFAFEAYLFQLARSMSVWVPFKGALFYPSVRQRDRQVRLSRREVYVCSHNEWTCSAMITADSGKRLLGYVMKQMEAVLRKVKKFKYKLSASLDMLSPVMADELRKAGIYLEMIVTDAVMAFYKEETKTVVRVNPGMLEKIRQEAYVTQERLIVPEEGAENPVYGDSREEKSITVQLDMNLASQADFIKVDPSDEDEWKTLLDSLTEPELEALRIIVNEKANLKIFADKQGIMLEVLAEGINEKAADAMGDSLLDNEFSIYEDYVEQIEEMLESVEVL